MLRALLPQAGRRGTVPLGLLLAALLASLVSPLQPAEACRVSAVLSALLQSPGELLPWMPMRAGLPVAMVQLQAGHQTIQSSEALPKVQLVRRRVLRLTHLHWLQAWWRNCSCPQV